MYMALELLLNEAIFQRLQQHTSKYVLLLGAWALQEGIALI